MKERKEGPLRGGMRKISLESVPDAAGDFKHESKGLCVKKTKA